MKRVENALYQSTQWALETANRLKMSYLCYSLEEAAQQLGMSETVLFRLSQFLKVPAAAYSEVGYISFKGDLTFNEEDIRFFGQVKDRLLAGETLEDVKNRIRGQQQSNFTPDVTFDMPVTPRPQTMISPEARNPVGVTAIESQDNRILQQAADQNFERYKGLHRPNHNPNRVFQNLAQEVVPETSQAVSDIQKPRPSQPLPPVRQPQPQVLPSSPPNWQPRPVSGLDTLMLPEPEADFNPEFDQNFDHDAVATFDEFDIEAMMSQRASMASVEERPLVAEPAVSVSPVQAELESQPWASMIRSAAENPRALNVRLKSAAQALRQKSLSQPISQRR